MINKGILGPWSDYSDRFVPDYDKLAELASHWRAIGLKIVLTSGSFDLIHTGHARYLEEAARHGDILVVGVDDDDKIRDRKGLHRPMVPQDERLEMLTHIRGVSVVTLKNTSHPKWQLVSAVSPDTLIATEGTYSSQEIGRLQEQYSCRVEVLARMAETSTSERIRQFNMNAGDQVRKAIQEQFPSFLQGIMTSTQMSAFTGLALEQ